MKQKRLAYFRGSSEVDECKLAATRTVILLLQILKIPNESHEKHKQPSGLSNIIVKICQSQTKTKRNEKKACLFKGMELTVSRCDYLHLQYFIYSNITHICTSPILIPLSERLSSQCIINAQHHHHPKKSGQVGKLQIKSNQPTQLSSHPIHSTPSNSNP